MNAQTDDDRRKLMRRALKLVETAKAMAEALESEEQSTLNLENGPMNAIDYHDAYSDKNSRTIQLIFGDEPVTIKVRIDHASALALITEVNDSLRNDGTARTVAALDQILAEGGVNNAGV